MKSIEICEELFQYICMLTRSAEREGRLDRLQIVRRVGGIMDRIEADIYQHNLGSQWDTVKQVLVYFVDYMLASSKLRLAGEWSDNRLADQMFGNAQMAGDEKFYHLLVESLQYGDRAMDDVLALFYMCLGLGFVGVPPRSHLSATLDIPLDFDDTQIINRMMQLIKNKIQIRDEQDRLLDRREYQVDATDMRQRPGMSVAIVFSVVCVLLVFLVIANGRLFDGYTQELEASLIMIQEASPGVGVKGD